ncbi:MULTISPECIES: hypothetical protein [unclassified Microcoleus]|uniref:hypothetical protein n=1 Tax=unclassified Microcoleus TaxID=2642155 RepID=UPI002FD25F53
MVVTSSKLKAKQANALIWAERIGFDAVYAVGGTLSGRQNDAVCDRDLITNKCSV